MKDLDRIPVGFKTCVEGASYRHIVLAIRHRPSKQWGAVRTLEIHQALGMSSLLKERHPYGTEQRLTTTPAVHYTVAGTQVGLSRREELMFKELRFDSLAALLEDYKLSYERWWHTVQKVALGGSRPFGS
jgi:hypothetical protein